MRNDRFEGFSIFDDKGEVKRLVDLLVRQKDPDVTLEGMRKMDYSYIFTLTKRDESVEIEILRPEIEESWDWRNDKIDPLLQKKIDDAIADL